MRRPWAGAPVPTPRLAAVAAALSLAVLVLPLDLPLGLLVVDGMLLAVGLADWALGVRPGAVEVERRMPGVLTLGQPGEIRWVVRNRSARRVRAAIADQVAPSLGATTRRLHTTVPAGGAAEAVAAIAPRRRGRFELGELTIRVDGPLGLAARQAVRRQVDVLRVYPTFRSRDEAELRIRRARVLEVGLRSAQGRGGGTEFESLREYTVDDEFRRVDWAATARVGRPIVRTYRAERNQSVLLLVDTGRTMAGRVEGAPRLEHAMDAVMAVVTVATRLGDRAGLVAYDRAVRAVVQPARSAGQLARVTEALYRLEPRLVESDHRGAFVEALARFRRRALLVVLTELAEQALVDTLVPAMPLVARHDLVVVGAARDPAVERWATAAPVDASGAYRKAAAVAALDGRARAAARLRGLGATVVDAAPGALAAGLADAYLRAKATGRL